MWWGASYLIVLMFPKKLIVSVECAIKLGSHRLSVTEDKWGVSSLQSVPLTQPLVLRGRACSQGKEHSSWRIHLDCALSWSEESPSNVCYVSEWLSCLLLEGSRFKFVVREVSQVHGGFWEFEKCSIHRAYLNTGFSELMCAITTDKLLKKNKVLGTRS